MLQNEYRQKNKILHSLQILATQSLSVSYMGNNYSNRNSISHLFAKFDLDLALTNFKKYS